MKIKYAHWNFEKYSNSNFMEIRRLGLVVPCGQKDGRTGGRTDGQIDMTILMVPFRNLAYASKMTSR